MKTRDFFFELPEALIAQYPPLERGKSRIMLFDRERGAWRHCMMSDVPAILSGPEFRSASGLPPLLVFNNSPVRKARLKAWPVAAAGRETEFLFVDRLDAHTWRVLSEKAKRKKAGSRYCFAEGLVAEIVKDPGADGRGLPSGGGPADGIPAPAGSSRLFLRFDKPPDDDWFERNGRVPLPPYIRRPDEAGDGERYQTVYADRKAAPDLGPGASAAAPTAGLHWTSAMLSELEGAGIGIIFVTLHVGLGTFLPVRAENAEDHLMHEENYTISEEAAHALNKAKAEGRKIVAIGTTSARTLESAWEEGPEEKGRLRAGEGSTSIFIYPSYRFRLIDALFTNFHTPLSSLLMLTAAFAGDGNRLRGVQKNAAGGLSLLLESYAEAIREGYRFFSYGDAMLLY